MEIRRRLLGIAIVGALLGGFAWWVLRPHEPIYQGQPLSFWLEEAHESGAYLREGLTTPAELALRARGTNAIPLLLRLARTPLDGFWNAIGYMAREDSSAYLHLPAQLYKHDIAAWGFKLLGPEARPAVPALARLLRSRNRDLQLSGLQCLQAIGPSASEAVSELVRLFQAQAAARHRNPGRGDSALYEEAAYALGEIGPAASAAIPVLAVETNEAAVVALIRIRGGALDSFFERLRDTSDPARWLRVASEVSRLGTNADAAVPFLVAALASTNNNIRWQAITQIGHIHRRPELCMPALTPLLHPSGDWIANTPNQVLAALIEFGPAAKPAFDDVARLLKHRDEGIRMGASNTLNAIDPAAAARAGVRPDHHDFPAHR